MEQKSAREVYEILKAAGVSEDLAVVVWNLHQARVLRDMSIELGHSDFDRSVIAGCKHRAAELVNKLIREI